MIGIDHMNLEEGLGVYGFSRLLRVRIDESKAAGCGLEVKPIGPQGLP